MTDLETSLIERVGELEKQIAERDEQIAELETLVKFGETNGVGIYGPLQNSVSQWTRQLRNYRVMAIGALACRKRVPTQFMVSKMRKWFDRGREITKEDTKIEDILFWI